MGLLFIPSGNVNCIKGGEKLVIVKNKLKKIMLTLTSFTMLLSLTVGNMSGIKASAQGTDSEGYTIIANASELDTLVRNNLSGKFRLGNDIDLTGYTSNTNSASYGWTAIGSSSGFKGTFDGKGYTIKGLWSKKAECNKGLFSLIMGATVKNVNVKLASAGITGSSSVGGIAGEAKSGAVIDNCTVAGGQVISTGGYAGGIVGCVTCAPVITVKNCLVTDTSVSASGNYAGGIVGFADKAQITSCRTQNTTVTGCSYAGGIAGAVCGASTISMGHAGGSVVTKASYAGGVAGAVYGASTVTQCCTAANVSACYYGGGAIGTLYEKSLIYMSGASGNVTVTNYISGGLVGEVVCSTVSDCYARGNVKGTTGVGGLVGYFSGTASSSCCCGNNNTVKNSYSSGSVTGTGTTEYGAFNGRSGVEYLGTNYYDSTKAGVSRAYGTAGSPQGVSSSFPQGKNTAAMMKRDTFVGWDFNNIWKIDENQSYPYFEYCGWWNEETLITFNKNAADATGTMTVQKVQKNVSATLNSNLFTRPDHIFLGWSASPTGDVVYNDGAAVSLAQSITLYAVWGTPDLYTTVLADHDTVNVGDIITFTVNLGNANTPRSTTLYNTVMYIYLSEHVDYMYNSFTAKLNGVAATVTNSYNYSTHIITVDLGDLSPGKEYSISYKTVALPSGEGKVIENNMYAEGDLTPYGLFSSNSNKFGLNIQGAKVKIASAGVSGATAGGSSKGIGGSTTIKVP